MTAQTNTKSAPILPRVDYERGRYEHAGTWALVWHYLAKDYTGKICEHTLTFGWIALEDGATAAKIVNALNETGYRPSGLP